MENPEQPKTEASSGEILDELHNLGKNLKGAFTVSLGK